MSSLKSINNSILPIKVLQSKFEEKFQAFDYDLYHELIEDRTFTDGRVDSSCLVMEVARLSHLFANKQLRCELDLGAAAVVAFDGWNISQQYISGQLNEIKVGSKLKKIAILMCKKFKQKGIKISLADMAGLLFCCAMLREKLYKEFEYHMIALDIDPKTNKIKVMAIQKPNK